jgi:hypothetical protein
MSVCLHQRNCTYKSLILDGGVEAGRMSGPLIAARSCRRLRREADNLAAALVDAVAGL